MEKTVEMLYYALRVRCLVLYNSARNRDTGSFRVWPLNDCAINAICIAKESLTQNTVSAFSIGLIADGSSLRFGARQ